jgi:hypothetical protein
MFHEWFDFESVILGRGFSRDNNSIVYYDRNSCYDATTSNSSFHFTVINFNQHSEYNRINFDDMYHILKDTKPSIRGNHQVNYGFSIQNIVDVDNDSFIRRPNLLKKSLQQKHNFVALSSLLIMYAPSLLFATHTQCDRCQRFGKSIDPQNILEGMTYAMTQIKQSEHDLVNTQLFNCHVDQFNSKSYNLEFCIIASTIRNHRIYQLLCLVILHHQE